MLVDATDYSTIYEKKSNRTCGAHGYAPNPAARPGRARQDGQSRGASWHEAPQTKAVPCPQVRIGAARAEVYFSPDDGVAKHVLDRLAAAKKSIHFMTFSYTEDTIFDAMIAQVKAGLKVRGVFELASRRYDGILPCSHR